MNEGTVEEGPQRSWTSLGPDSVWSSDWFWGGASAQLVVFDVLLQDHWLEVPAVLLTRGPVEQSSAASVLSQKANVRFYLHMVKLLDRDRSRDGVRCVPLLILIVLTKSKL